MSTADQLYGTSIAAHLDASQTVHRSNDDQVHPYTHPLPAAASQDPSYFQPGFTSQYPSFTPATYGMGNHNFYATCPGNGTVYPPALSMPPMWNPMAAMNYLQTPYYPAFDPSAATTMNSTASILTSEDIGHEVLASLQSTYSLLSQANPLESQAIPEVQDTQEEVAVEAQQGGLGDVQSNNEQSHMQSYASAIEQQDAMTQSYGSNLQHEYSSHGGVHPDLQNAFVAAYQDPFSAAAYSFLEDAYSSALDERQSTSGQCSHVPSLHSPSFWSPGPSESSMTPSTSTSAQASPSDLSLSPLSYSAAPSPLDAVAPASASKQRRFAPYPIDHSRRPRQRRTKQGPKKTTQPTNGKKKHVKVKKPVNGYFICLICEALGNSRPALSRKDALKRHILDLHAMFAVLLYDEKYEDFNLLAPRHQLEDLTPLMWCCTQLENDARARGGQINEA